MVKWILICAGIIASLISAYAAYTILIANPRVAEELQNHPDGEQAARVMMLELPDGRQIPVNYLREAGFVYVGADGPWWRQFTPDGVRVHMLIQGESVSGIAQTILNNPEYTKDVFSRLRPTAPAWLPDALNGKLIEITVSVP